MAARFARSLSSVLSRRNLCNRRVGPRNFSSSQSPTEIVNVPLSESLPNLPKAKYAVITNEKNQTKITTLENGLRVASVDKFGQFFTVGVIIDSGPRYESQFPSGIQHFLEKLAFGSTQSYKDRDSIMQKLEHHGGICDCQGTRDSLIYAVSAESHGLDTVIDILSDVILAPQLTEEEMNYGSDSIEFDITNMNMQPNPEPILMELVHAQSLYTLWSRWYTPAMITLPIHNSCTISNSAPANCCDGMAQFLYILGYQQRGPHQSSSLRQVGVTWQSSRAHKCNYFEHECYALKDDAFLQYA